MPPGLTDTGWFYFGIMRVDAKKGGPVKVRPLNFQETYQGIA